jgi:hypothetical protein
MVIKDKAVWANSNMDSIKNNYPIVLAARGKNFNNLNGILTCYQKFECYIRLF